MTDWTLAITSEIAALGHRRAAELRYIQRLIEQQTDAVTMAALVAEFRHQLANDFCTIQYYVLQGDQIDAQNS